MQDLIDIFHAHYYNSGLDFGTLLRILYGVDVLRIYILHLGFLDFWRVDFEIRGASVDLHKYI